MSCVCCALVIVSAVHLAKCLLYIVDRKPRSGDILYTKMQCSQAASTSVDPDHYLLLWWWLAGLEREDNNVRKWYCISFKWEQAHRSLQTHANTLSSHILSEEYKWEFEKNENRAEPPHFFTFLPVFHYSPCSLTHSLSLFAVLFTPSILPRYSTLASSNHSILQQLGPSSSVHLFNQGRNESQEMGLTQF